MTGFVNWFTKITAYPIQYICFRTKVYCKDKTVQNRRIKGPAIVICNHTSIFDYAVLLFVFFSRTVRYQMAEVLFRKKLLGAYLKALGGIYVNRDTHDFSFMAKSEQIIQNGGVVGIFPESRIPENHESTPLPFKPSAAQLALLTGVPVIPVYTNGSYFCKKRARVIIGTPINVYEYTNEALSDKENLTLVTQVLRNEIICLRDDMNERIAKQ